MTDPHVVDLGAVGADVLKRAAESASGRAAQVVRSAPDAGFSQVVLAICAGRELADHANPGEATLQVLSGLVRLSSGDETWSLSAGQLVAIPHRRHAVFADEDSVAMLTIVRSQEGHG